MDMLLARLMFAVALGSLWDIRRGQRLSDALVREVQAMAEADTPLTPTGPLMAHRAPCTEVPQCGWGALVHTRYTSCPLAPLPRPDQPAWSFLSRKALALGICSLWTTS